MRDCLFISSEEDKEWQHKKEFSAPEANRPTWTGWDGALHGKSITTVVPRISSLRKDFKFK